MMRRRLLVGASLVLVALVVAGSAGATYAYFWDRGQADVIAPGIRIAGVDVGGLHAAVARTRLQRRVARPLRRPLRLVAGSWSTTVERSRLVRIDLGSMVAEAVAESRKGPLHQRVLRELEGRKLAVSVPLEAGVVGSALDRVVARVARALDRAPRSARVIPSATHLRVVPSRPGLAVERSTLRSALRASLLDSASTTLSVPTRPVPPKLPTALLSRRFPSYLLVDRAHYQLRLYRQLKLARTYRIAVGQAGLETPAGLYRINDREVDPSWHVPLSAWAGSLAGQVIPPGPADPLKARWLGFYDGAGIHGTDEVSSIGTAASHGCIRMAIPDVIALYPLVPLGTPIYVG
jgi:L,D-transpeptidase catalytic domain/Putative peptidoglycan binding domain